MEFLDHPIAMILVGILSFPVYKTLAKVFFGDNYEDLAESLTIPSYERGVARLLRYDRHP